MRTPRVRHVPHAKCVAAPVSPWGPNGVTRVRAPDGSSGFLSPSQGVSFRVARGQFRMSLDTDRGLIEAGRSANGRPENRRAALRRPCGPLPTRRRP